ncbi:MAG TPA: hypothetical protein VLI06_08925 [Solimonas sp.]|nr:hypothetical protein [Solimonas sp.]
MTLEDALDFCNDLTAMVRAWAVEPLKALEQARQIEQCFLLDLPGDHRLVMHVSAAIAAVQDWLHAGLEGRQDPQLKRLANQAIEELRAAVPDSYDRPCFEAEIAA